jgi:Tol biopolymer transport system component
MSNDKEYRQEFAEGMSMASDVLGIGRKRAIILLAVMVAVLFAAISLMPGEPAAQTASPNGKIAYVGYNTESNKHIYTMNSDGTGVTNLTSRYTDSDPPELGSIRGDPEWSPDGTKISFTGFATDYQDSCCSTNVYVMDAGGANLQRLTDTPSSFQGEDFQATWAPDGSWLAFTSTRSEGSHDPDNLTSNASDDREIYRMDDDGTNELQLTANPPVSSDEQPSISPDGTKIAFASSQHYSEFGDPDGDQLDIYVMNADGTGEATRLTFDSGTKNPNFQLLSESRNPAWSPDGTRIAFESNRSGNNEIWVMNADGSDPVNVSQHASYDSDPEWSPDGAQITFTSRREGQEDIWAVDAPPLASPTTTASFSTFGVVTDTALAASTPRNLTPGSGLKAVNPSWGTAPSSGVAACTIRGTTKPDNLSGTMGADVICAFGGNDTVSASGGKDLIKGGAGDDTLRGQGGGDTVVGNTGSDTLVGGGGDDKLHSRDGVSGNDTLDGGTHQSGDEIAADASEKSIVGFP